ncbi:hypothetical protein [Salinithrix halophila]|uniref:Uncharacterized protein n=1 Tax=Salinithrix halophila TaxID=1485204 RepID=A0ABV8JE47_9BACL
MKPKDPQMKPRMEPKNLTSFVGEDEPGTQVTDAIQETLGPTPDGDVPEQTNRDKKKQPSRRT